MLSLAGLRCTNFVFHGPALASGRFDPLNPCSACRRRRTVLPDGPAFFYRPQQRWEFPFANESSCLNFSLLHAPVKHPCPSEPRPEADRVGELGEAFFRHWAAFDAGEVPSLGSYSLQPGAILYPGGMSADAFSMQVAEVQMSLSEMRPALARLEEKWSIRDEALGRWMNATSRQMRVLHQQIDMIEAVHNPSRLSVVSKWAVDHIGGPAVWEGLRQVIRTIMSA